MHDDVDRVLKTVVKPAMFGESVPFTVLAHHVHGEPITVAEARRRPYEPFAVGDAWGGAWDTTWFRFQATVPDAWATREVVARIEFDAFGVGFTAEALIWDDN